MPSLMTSTTGLIYMWMCDVILDVIGLSSAIPHPNRMSLSSAQRFLKIGTPDPKPNPCPKQGPTQPLLKIGDFGIAVQKANWDEEEGEEGQDEEAEAMHTFIA